MTEVAEGFDSSAKRESLLDVVLDRLNKAGKTAIFTRIIYVARFLKREQTADVAAGTFLLLVWILPTLKQTCCPTAAAFQRKLIDKSDHNNEVTGMLLVYPTCMIHLLEVRLSEVSRTQFCMPVHGLDSRH